VEIAPGFELASLLDGGYLAMGDPDHVPAGIYGKQALVSLGVWDTVARKLAPARDVRTALVLVARREAPMGLVYATDAVISTRVRVLAMFPQTSHPAITYPVAILKGRNGDASRPYLKFLKTPEARTIFEKFGFFVR
jgi:molybdate transport system substrate-binding protein